MLCVGELVLLTALVLGCRCANYREVFIRGDIYFADADCYARMTRARMVFEHPGLVVRHHRFENFPNGTNPHTTAPFDYTVVGLAWLLHPFSPRALELAGAFVSPMFGLAGSWFLWWWLRRMHLPFRAAPLILWAASPIIVHATELGRPDHQSIALVSVMIALCAEWTLRLEWSRAWSVISALAWALSLWVSLYEPLVVFTLVMSCRAIVLGRKFFAARERPWWLIFGSALALASVIERRSLTFSLNEQALMNWLATIGELHPLTISSRSWIDWCGYLLPVAPVLAVISFRRRTLPPLFITVAGVATFGLTMWQARWGYFFVALFALSLPALLSSLPRARVAGWSLVAISMFPLLQAWDASLWPNESLAAHRAERRRESVDLRNAAAAIVSAADTAFIAPWWLSPAIAYWSGEPGVAGSSHESLGGSVETARFFLTADPNIARRILIDRRVAWIVSYDSERVVADSAQILGASDPGPRTLGRVLDRSPSSAPAMLVPVYANGSCKLFRVQISREKVDFPWESR